MGGESETWLSKEDSSGRSCSSVPRLHEDDWEAQRK